MEAISDATLDGLCASSGEPLALVHAEIGSETDEAGQPFALDAAPPVHPLFGIDDDIEADFAAIGIEFTHDAERAATRAQLEASASLALRRIVGAERELDRLHATMDLQMQAIRFSYERQMAPVRARHAQLTRYVETLAELTPWGKKKSADTPFGSFGVKDFSASVAVEDGDILTEHAVAHIPGFVTVAITMPLSEAREHFTAEEIESRGTVKVEWGALKKTLGPSKEVPPGVTVVPARREAFAKPMEASV
jgi:hypothetical protein